MAIILFEHLRITPFYVTYDLRISLSVFLVFLTRILPLNIILLILYKKEQSPLITKIEKIKTKENNKINLH